MTTKVFECVILSKFGKTKVTKEEFCDVKKPYKFGMLMLRFQNELKQKTTQNKKQSF